MMRLGVVSFLNSRPLIDPLKGNPNVVLQRAVPSALAAMLQTDQVDAALVPVVDLARSAGAWQRVCNAGIACRGETMTVRVFSQVEPRQVSVLHVDSDSHTSVILAQLIWRRWFKQPVRVREIARNTSNGLEQAEAVLLIGDKVVTDRPTGYAHEVDLGTAWLEWTGMPFVFATWVMPAQRPEIVELAGILEAARDRGTSQVAAIAAEYAPQHGWPVDLARRYLSINMQYRLTDEHLAGMQKFFELATAEGLLHTGKVRIG